MQNLGKPFSLLVTSLDELAQEKDEETKSRIKDIAGKLKELMEPVLDLTSLKLKPNVATLQINEIKIGDFIQDFIKAFGPVLEEKKVTIILNNQWNRESFYYNQNLLGEIFNLILSNSVKYSFDKGKIIMNLIQTNDGDLKVHIADNGIGLPIKEQETITKYFSNPELDIPLDVAARFKFLEVRNLIGKLGGRIGFESSKNQGTTYTFILNNQHVKPAIATKDNSKKTVRKSTGKKPQPPAAASLNINTTASILIAEDNDELRKVFVGLFTNLGIIYEAKNGIEALKIASDKFPNVILANNALPDMNGLALINSLKNKKELQQTAVFLMLSQIDEVNFPQDSSSEMVTIIKKPVNLDSLYNSISQRLNAGISLPYRNLSLSERNSNILSGNLDEAFLAKLENLILQNLPNNSGIEDLSEAMGMTSFSLSQKIKAIEGSTPLDFINRTKLSYAKTLMSNGNSNLAEVSRLAGFPNKDVFFSAYKKQYGFMPGTIIER